MSKLFSKENKNTSFPSFVIPKLSLPKRGFTNIFAKQYAEVKLSDLNKFEDGAVVDIEKLLADGVIKNACDGLKILGEGDINTKLTVKASKFTASAKAKIEAAGGTVA